MKKLLLRLTAIIAAVLVCITMSGCGFTTFLTPAETIRPPRITGEFEGVRTALEASVGSDIVMEYPKGDNGVASFMTADLDGDGTDEVLAFYRQDTEASVTRINLLKSDSSGGWVSVQDLDPVGIALDSVSFCDLDNDGCQEVVTGWNMYDAKNKEMAIYKMDSGLLTQRASERYTEYVLCDINSDSVTEIVVLLLSSAEQTASVSAFKFSSAGGITIAGSAPLDGGVTSYAKITVGKAGEEVPALYIDAFKGTTATLTELVYWDDGKLVNAYYNDETGETSATLRSFTEYCRETREGEMLIPFEKPLFGQSEDAEVRLSFTEWRVFEDSADKISTVTFKCDDYSYYFNLPEQWYDSVSVTYGSDSSVLIFYEYDPVSGSKKGELMRIRIFEAGQTEEAQSLGYEVIASDRTYIYTVRLVRGNELSIDLAAAREGFEFI